MTSNLEFNDDLYANEGQSKEDNIDEEDFYDDFGSPLNADQKKSPGAASKKKESPKQPEAVIKRKNELKMKSQSRSPNNDNLTHMNH